MMNTSLEDTRSRQACRTYTWRTGPTAVQGDFSLPVLQLMLRDALLKLHCLLSYDPGSTEQTTVLG